MSRFVIEHASLGEHCFDSDRNCERVVVMLAGGPYDGQDILANRMEVVRGLLVRNEQMYVRSATDYSWPRAGVIPLFRWLSVCRGPCAALDSGG